MDWILIDTLQDSERFFTGACIRFYNTDKSFEEQCALPCGKDDYLDYIISEIYGNSDYFQLTCLSQGEAGNIICVLRRENGDHYVTGSEIKRMLKSDLHKILIHPQPKIELK